MSNNKKDKANDPDYTSVTIFILKSVHKNLKIQCIKEDVRIRDYLEEVVVASVKEGNDE
jgi:hypothetical protein